MNALRQVRTLNPQKTSFHERFPTQCDGMLGMNFASSEVTRQIHLPIKERSVLVTNQILQPGMIVASAFVDNKSAFISVINTFMTQSQTVKTLKIIP